MSQYIIGIDLGTTNSVVSYCARTATREQIPELQLLSIPQVVSANVIDSLQSLASFAYLPNPAETQDKAFGLPWDEGDESENQTEVVGDFARTRSAEAPDRTVGAAKSWLCHAKVDRRAKILPWNSPTEVARISPVEATRQYLSHLVSAWNHQFPENDFKQQQIILTVPASFDPVARELTREAALEAGFPEDFILLEEPQAAVYAWLAQQHDTWRKELHVGDSILVCDVGGGTTDLTLVAVEDDAGELMLRRVAVGDHLLVGGDNMDLAAAYHVSTRFAEQGTQLNPWQTISLWHSCRAAKERLLSDSSIQSHTISVLGRGSKLIGGTISTDVERNELSNLLLNGFFPECELSARPQRQPASGFQEIGLPYESDPAITRHIAAFVSIHCQDSHGRINLPKHVLFNGGVFKSEIFQDRLLSVMTQWSNNIGGSEVIRLAGVQDLDFAVSKGACYYGWSKDVGGLRIRGGTASSYYVGIETAGLAIPGAPRPLKALCVVPFGMEEGTEVNVPAPPIGLVLGQPVHFRFFNSKVRKEDQPGLQLDSWTDDVLTETEPLIATLPHDASDENYVPVTFESRITELGIFELWCVSAEDAGRWKLEFSIREDE